MPLNRVHIKNFSIFEDTSIHFAKHVNVFIGENGTGKTHLLKLLYAFFETEAEPCLYENQGEKITLNIKDNSLFSNNFFNNLTLVYKSLKIIPSNGNEVHIEFDIDKKIHNLVLNVVDGEMYFDPEQNVIGKIKNKAVFIPAKEMLSHADGLIEMTKKYSNNMPFDKTLLDIIEKAKQWQLKQTPAIAQRVYTKLESLIKGKIVFENNRFYIEKNDGKRIDFDLESEGFKKIGLIWQLIMNENITDGSILLWDEPESNINPKLIPEIVDIMLILARCGVQIIIATHDYFLAKYFEVLSSVLDLVSFHSLYFENGTLKCETSDKFTTLSHNDIISENIKLYEAEIQKVIQ
ncbi:MAG: AAA family ATPase [Oscillospiraceae bacterium]|nr:AAA family ATPase [Oscillospiraceae bacterium]